MHAFIASKGCKLTIKYHEIYLSAMRRAALENYEPTTDGLRVAKHAKTKPLIGGAGPAVYNWLVVMKLAYAFVEMVVSASGNVRLPSGFNGQNGLRAISQICQSGLA